MSWSMRVPHPPRTASPPGALEATRVVYRGAPVRCSAALLGAAQLRHANTPLLPCKTSICRPLRLALSCCLLKNPRQHRIELGRDGCALGANRIPTVQDIAGGDTAAHRVHKALHRGERAGHAQHPAGWAQGYPQSGARQASVQLNITVPDETAAARQREFEEFAAELPY